MPFIEMACSIVPCQATIDRASIATTTARLIRHDSTLNAARGPSLFDEPTMSCIGSIGAAPCEGDVLARLSAPVPLEAEAVSAIHFCGGPGCHRIGPDFRAWRIERLHTLTRQCCRAGERFGPCLDPARNGGAPCAEIAGYFELDRSEFDAAHL